MKNIKKFLGKISEFIWGFAMYFYGGWALNKNSSLTYLYVAGIIFLVYIISVFCKEDKNKILFIKINGKELDLGKYKNGTIIDINVGEEEGVKIEGAIYVDEENVK